VKTTPEVLDFHGLVVFQKIRDRLLWSGLAAAARRGQTVTLGMGA
jgi:hypothetical protein